MARFGKPNNTGRSSGKHNGRRGQNLRPPSDQGGWVWHTAHLLESEAWCAQSIHCRRLIDFLELEQCNNSGQENGRLMAPYNQLVKFGLSRGRIKEAIDEAIYLGLVRITLQGGRWGDTNQPSLYRLTYYGSINGHDTVKPTNEWRHVTKQAITLWKEQARKKRRKKTNSGYPHSYYESIPIDTSEYTTLKLATAKVAESSQS